jgi:hypothetical protein
MMRDLRPSRFGSEDRQRYEGRLIRETRECFEALVAALGNALTEAERLRAWMVAHDDELHAARPVTNADVVPPALSGRAPSSPDDGFSARASS